MALRFVTGARSVLRGCGGLVALGLGYSAFECYEHYGNVRCTYSSSPTSSGTDAHQLDRSEVAWLSPAAAFWDAQVVADNRHHLQVFHVPLPEALSDKLLASGASTAIDGSSGPQVSLDLQPILSLLNSFTFRVELCAAALVCLGPAVASKCIWRTSIPQCVDFLHQRQADSATNEEPNNEQSSGWINVSRGRFGPWDIVQLADQSPSLVAPTKPIIFNGEKIEISKLLGKEAQLVFTPLAEKFQKQQRSDNSGGSVGEGGTVVPLFSMGCPLEAMAARVVVATSTVGGNGEETAGTVKPKCVLQFSHIIFPFDQLERGSTAEAQTLKAHDVFCRVIAAQMCKSLSRLC